MEIAQELRQYADYRATPDDLSRLLFRAADMIDEMSASLGDMLREFDDPNVTDDLKTQIGMPANTVKALQRTRGWMKDPEVVSIGTRRAGRGPDDGFRYHDIPREAAA